MPISNEIPKVAVLGPITPTVDSVRAEQLDYEKLAPAVEKHAPYEVARLTRFWDTEEDSLEELEAARQLALQYMLMGSLALTRTSDPELWSDRYTESTSALFGVPDATLACSLWKEQQLGASGELDKELKGVAEKVATYLDERYAPVFEALDSDSSVGRIDPNGIAERFEKALCVLGEQYDSDWKQWEVVRNEEKDVLSVSAESRKISVGMLRASVDPLQLKALFSHEVLVHGLRGLNGQKVSKELGSGLVGYLDAEEGLGVFFEYAIGGKIPDKNVDRYVDIAYALGQIDGQKHTRQELINHALERATMRNEAQGALKSEDDIKKEVYAHVNRIYRGSLGDSNVGVFTKDISYHKGFIEMGAYIKERLDGGASIQDVMDYLLAGKFDPSNRLHANYVRS